MIKKQKYTELASQADIQERLLRKQYLDEQLRPRHNHQLLLSQLKACFPKISDSELRKELLDSPDVLQNFENLRDRLTSDSLRTQNVQKEIALLKRELVARMIGQFQKVANFQEVPQILAEHLAEFER